MACGLARRSWLGSFACPHFMPAARASSHPGRAIEKVRCVWVGNGTAFFVKFCKPLDGEKKWNRLPRSYVPSGLADAAARPENCRFSFVNEEGKIKVGGGKDVRAPIGISHAATAHAAPELAPAPTTVPVEKTPAAAPVKAAMPPPPGGVMLTVRVLTPVCVKMTVTDPPDAAKSPRPLCDATATAYSASKRPPIARRRDRL